MTVTAALDEPAPEGGTTVTLTTGGTATPGADYTLSSSTIVIAEGQTTGTATITVIDDADDDDGETIVLDAASVNPALTAATLTLTIEDNDAAADDGADAVGVAGAFRAHGDGPRGGRARRAARRRRPRRYLRGVRGYAAVGGARAVRRPPRRGSAAAPGASPSRWRTGRCGRPAAAPRA